MIDFTIKKRIFNWALMLLLSMPFLYSCVSYNQIMGDYYQNIKRGNYEKASGIVSKSKFMKKKRNKLLYDFENGRMQFLTNNYKKSNEYLNEADDLLESNYKTGKDIAVSNIVNPMMETYRGEEFEKFLVHFYKAINYAALNKPEDAVVEARRITLTSVRLNNKFKNSSKRYNADAFSLNLQGMLYETAGDINNAFISYRNAANIYLNRNNNYYGVSIPEQLKYDLINTAEKMGFSGDKAEYETKFNKEIKTSNNERELILFLEEGNGPVKEEKSITVVYSNGKATYQFVDQYGVYHSEPFDFIGNGINSSKLSDFRTIKIALPTYRIVYPRSSEISIELNQQQYHPEITQDLNTLSLSILQERFLSDLSKAVLRYMVKHSVEKGSDKLATRIAENHKKNSADSESEKKNKEENAKLVGDAVGFLVGITNTITEKADTRGWMSLPAYIHYIRLPLQDGNNIINIKYKGIQKSIEIEGKKGIQLKCMTL